MIKKIQLGVLLLLNTLTLLTASAEVLQSKKNPFIFGEQLKYKVELGILNVGEAEVNVATKLYNIRNTPCYFVHVKGKTTGLFSLATKVRDEWASYIDTTTLLPKRFFMNIREMSYRKKQEMKFYHKDEKVKVEKLHKRTGAFIAEKEYKITANTQDIISGTFKLRSVDFSNLTIADTVFVPGFFDGEEYNMNVVFIKKEKIKTKIGEYNAAVFSPLMPNNKMFDGGESIRFWISDDEFKIPLKVKAKLFIGSLELNITDYNVKKEQDKTTLYDND